ncbi:MAG: class I SAM-dependent methyltransferase [Chloroflexi bacterium]|nr:class I SAM-dependent methyltransferase [Chloroflexota bacterium]
MNPETIRRLNAINREFYRITAPEFDQTRGTAWPGWERLLPYLRAPLSVLDVGCGNGRFGVFLHEKVTRSKSSVISHQSSELSTQYSALSTSNSELGTRNPELSEDWRLFYQGVDSSAALLERARAALSGLPGLTIMLEERDIVENPPDAGDYDLVALFGVIHHVPGYTQRQELLRRLAERVKPGGLLAFAAWLFYEYERFRERIAPWPDDVPAEPNDYLLDWRRGQTALRYCHYVDDAEHAALVAATGLRELLTFRADGEGGQANRYSLLQRV